MALAEKMQTLNSISSRIYSHQIFPRIIFSPEMWSSLFVALSVWWGLAQWGQWGGFSWPCQHPSMPQLCSVPCSRWSGCLSAPVTGEGGWRWIRGMTKISPTLTPLWVARHCHTFRDCVITVTFGHFKAHRQVWFHKACAHYWSTGLGFIRLLLIIFFYWNSVIL